MIITNSGIYAGETRIQAILALAHKMTGFNGEHNEAVDFLDRL